MNKITFRKPANSDAKQDYHLLWPRKLSDAQTSRVRTGRVLHWLGLASGAGFLAFGLYAMTVVEPGLFGMLKLMSSTCYGIGCVLAGRMARMVLARE